MTPTQQDAPGGTGASGSKAENRSSAHHHSTGYIAGQASNGNGTNGNGKTVTPDIQAIADGMHVDPPPAAQGATAGAPVRFALMTAAELTALPPVKWLIKGELPQGGFAVLYGPSGVGKSTVALDLAFTVAAFRPVVYVAAEGAGGYAQRVLAWQCHHGRSAGELHFLPEAVNLIDDKERGALMAALATVTPALIVFDTLARCLVGADENSARDMGLAIDALDDIRRLTGAAVLVVHHTGKSGSSERGSSALRGAADSMLELSESDGLLTLAVSKTKDAAPNPPRYLRLVTVETGRRRDDGEAETACVALASAQVYTAGQLTQTGRRVLETLALEIFKDAGARTSQLMADLAPIQERKLHRALSALKRDGYISQSTKGDPYAITDAGRLALGGSIP